VLFGLQTTSDAPRPGSNTARGDSKRYDKGTEQQVCHGCRKERRNLNPLTIAALRRLPGIRSSSDGDTSGPRKSASRKDAQGRSVWRREGDSNPRYRFSRYDGLANRWIKPLSHLSVGSPEQKSIPLEKIRGTRKKILSPIPGGWKSLPARIVVPNRPAGRKTWRRRWDSNPRYRFRYGGFQDRCLKPLDHSSARNPSTNRIGAGFLGQALPAVQGRKLMSSWIRTLIRRCPLSSATDRLRGTVISRTSPSLARRSEPPGADS
jgi:hypothetical protein